MSPPVAETPTAARRPLVVQSDGSLLLETAAPGADDARDDLLRFAELVKSPEHLHTYRATPLSLWNAAAAGHDAASVLATLERHARFPVPASVRALVHAEAARWGRLRLLPAATPARLRLRLVESRDPGEPSSDGLARELSRRPELAGLLEAAGPGAFELEASRRGAVKLALARLGWPVLDAAGCDPGAPLALDLLETTRAGRPFALRPYQDDAVRALIGAGSGTVVLPCGSGKTIVGLAAIVAAGARTLIVAPGTSAARQWRDELLDKTTLAPADVVELSSESRARRPRSERALGSVTIATASLLAKKVGASFPHLEAVAREDWGLLVLDEVHLLPEPLLRFLESRQGTRRLGLTATLGREDGRERDVFALVGPRLSSVPWKLLERQGWIAEALCAEVRVPLSPAGRLAYLQASPRERPTLAAENPHKLSVLERLLERHAREPLLILGSHLDLLEQAAALANAPLVSGTSPAREREALFGEFRSGKLRRLVLSKVGSHAIDLPEASVAIQLSGTFGSRQEEAQRLGRILRPKQSGAKARFYALVSQGTVEEEHALRRQLFLTEQGYRYEVEDALGASSS